MTDYSAYATCECYYKFENAANLGEDAQGQIHLTNNNGVSQSSTIPSGTYANPTAQKSADFVRTSSQYLSANHDDSIEIDDLTEAAICFWFRADEWVGSSGDVIFINKGDTTTGFLVIYFDSSTEDFACKWDGTYGAYRDVTFSIGTWYFVAWTYSATTDQLRCFYGTEESQVSELGSPDSRVDRTASTAYGVSIGRNNYFNTHYFDGLMTEIAVFSEALALSDLQAIQQYGMAGEVFVPYTSPLPAFRRP